MLAQALTQTIERPLLRKTHSLILSYSDPLVLEDLFSFLCFPVCFPSGEEREHLNGLLCCVINRSVFRPPLSSRFCCIGEQPSVQPAAFNTCKSKHSWVSVLQGLFRLLFFSSLSSFALHLDPNAVNISTVVKLAPFIINRSPSAVKGTRVYEVTTSKSQLLQCCSSVL